MSLHKAANYAYNICKYVNKNVILYNKEYTILIISDYLFQVDTQSSLCSVMDVSSTSQAIAFGDQAGHLHLFSPQHNHEPVFNNFSR